ncbi:MAG: heparinase II/III family protein, partial [Candidatus Glassbacteria bacterium]
FDSLRAQVDGYLAAGPDSLPVRTAGRLAEKCGFLWLVTGDRKYLEAGSAFLARALERHLALEKEQGGGYWEAVEFRRYCCFAWDWLYDGLDAGLRRHYGEKLLAAGKTAWEKKWFNPYGGGGYGTLDPVFWPAVTLAGSGIEDSLAGQWLAWTDRNIHEWRKMQSQVAADDGGMYSGPAYAAYNYLRTPIFDLEIWKCLTSEDLTENNPYLEYFSIWWVNLLKPNGEWPRLDDAGSVKGGIQPWHFKYLACRYHDRVSLWYLDQMPKAREWNVWDVIWDPAQLDLEPEGPDNSWPLARLFEGIGWVVLRSGWDSSASYAVFDCGPFYYGHQHPAENGFTIFRRGSLAINSGRYEWESNHRPNYAARTIASNNVLVYDPAEVFVAGRRDTLSNDGGQMWPIPERDSVGESAGTRWDTGRIIAFETNPRYSYVCGDAARAYNSNKLKSFTRQFIHLQPDLFVVFDRVESTRPEFAKYWLLHTANESTLKGRAGWAGEREGKLFLEAVFPEDARVRKVGGPGHEFDIFGVNHPPAVSYYPVGEGEEWGAWRFEITPGRQREKDTFLVVLAAAAAGEKTGPAVERLAAVDGFEGARISYQGKTFEVSFATQGRPAGRVKILDEKGQSVLAQELTANIQPQSGIGK